MLLDHDVGLTGEALREQHDVLDDAVQVRPDQRRLARPAEVEQRLDDLVQAVDLLLDDLGRLFDPGGVALRILEQLHRRPDDAERVADLVRDTRGQLAHRRQTVRSDELVGERLDVRDVLERHDRAEDRYRPPRACATSTPGRAPPAPPTVTSVVSRIASGSRPARTLATSPASPPSTLKSRLIGRGTISNSEMSSMRSAAGFAVATEPSGPTVMTPEVIERRIDCV